MVAEVFAGVDVRQMHLDNVGVRPLDGIENGNRGVAVGAGIENDRLAGAPRLLNPGDEIAFVIRSGGSSRAH